MKLIENHINVKDYLTKSNLPLSDYVINPYIGCPHACIYCYACFMKHFTGHIEDWGTFIDIKHTNKTINKKRLKGKFVLLSSVTDCYNQYEKKYKITRSILEQMIAIDCNLTICTKSDLILRDLDLLKQCKHLKVAISLNTLNDDFRKSIESASSISARLHTLEQLHSHNIHTVLFMAPLFPYITDFKDIIECTSEYIDEYWFQSLNLSGSYQKNIMSFIKNEYPQLYSSYYDIYINKNNTYWNNLSDEITSYCTTHHLNFTNFLNQRRYKTEQYFLEEIANYSC